MKGAGQVLVVSCYELGRQPVAAANALAALAEAGFAPRVLDVSVERLDDQALRSARPVAISVPMHTALPLGGRRAPRAPRVAAAALGVRTALARGPRAAGGLGGGDARLQAPVPPLPRGARVPGALLRGAAGGGAGGSAAASGRGGRARVLWRSRLPQRP